MIQRTPAPAGGPAANPAPEKETFVVHAKAGLYTPPPELKATRGEIPEHTVVEILEEVTAKRRAFVRVRQTGGGSAPLAGWIKKSNLTALNKPRTYKLSATTQKVADRILKHKSVGVDPKAWFSNFVHTTFLGRRTATPVHAELADILKKVEAGLVAKHGGPGQDPKVAGDKLGLSSEPESLKGARPDPTSAKLSMHFFGLAVDIDYNKNPYITESANDTQALAAVLGRAGELIWGEKGKFKTSELLKASTSAAVASISELNELLQGYFELLDYPDKDLAEVLAAEPAGSWRKLSVKRARKRIQDDLKWVTGVWRAARSQKQFSEDIKKGGFTALSPELVTALEDAGLYWGGRYGDMMHFDSRNTGTGQKIDAVRR